MVKDPSKRVAACEEFFLLGGEAHILTAAKQVFGMSSQEDRPSVQLFPENSCELSPVQRRQVLLLGTQEIVNKFVDVLYPPTPASEPETDPDRVCAYARELLSLGQCSWNLMTLSGKEMGLKFFGAGDFFYQYSRLLVGTITPLKRSQCFHSTSSRNAASACVGAHGQHTWETRKQRIV